MPHLTKIVLTVQDELVGPILRQLAGKFDDVEFHHIEIKDGRSRRGPGDPSQPRAKSSAHTGTRAAIQKLLATGRPMTARAIYETLGLTTKQAANALTALKKAKLVKHNKRDGTWSGK